MRTPQFNNNGFLLHETDDIVIIATGVKNDSTNDKTGAMIQIYILYRHMKPMQAVQAGADAAICMDCPHRGRIVTRKTRTGWKTTVKRSCYVNIGKGANMVYGAYSRGRYEYLPIERYAEVFGGRLVRFGAYGEPVLLPIDKARAIATVAAASTGYTHQWRRPEFAEYRDLLMASVDTPELQAAAAAAGWRTFRIKPTDGARLANEVICPASKETGALTQYERCKLCDDARADDKRKSVAITVHGAGAGNFVQITAAA